MKEVGRRKETRTHNAPLQKQKGIWVADVDLPLPEADGEDGSLWGAAVEEDEEGALAAAEVGEQEGEEGVDDEGLGERQ
jgi:hypothetical protein